MLKLRESTDLLLSWPSGEARQGSSSDPRALSDSPRDPPFAAACDIG